jgi:hypothetical protein
MKKILHPQDPSVFLMNGKPCCRIQLSRGQSATISAHRFAEISRTNWFAWWNPKTRSYYATRIEKRNGKRFSIHMHNQIAPSKRGLITDHRNKNSLDNRDENLRTNTTKGQNMQNSGKRRNNKSGYKWVTYVPRLDKYLMQVTTNGKRSTGLFATAQEAYEAACAIAKKEHGEFYRPE